jgi:ribonuclease E
MSRIMLMDAKHPDETRVVIVDNDTIEDFDFVTSSKDQIKGNIYLAKITRVEPSLQAAFVEYGGGKQGFLPFSEIHPDYYQIPTEDRARLIEEELAEAAREEEAEEAEIEQKESKREGGNARGRGRSRRRGRRGGRNDDEENSEAQSAEDGEKEAAVSAEAPEEQASDDEAETEATTQPLAAKQPEVASEPVTEESAEATEETADEPDDVQAEVEAVGADDAEERPRRRGAAFKRYRIQEVIKRNQIVLVQVIKEERGNKGCSLTSYLSLAGRYCVLMPNSPKGGGVSRKINNGEQRKKLKEMLQELRDKRGFPAIIRTAGLDRTKAEIKRDYEYLVKMWTQIREDTLSSTAPSLIYEESDIIKRSIRDMYTNDIEQVLVQGAEAFRDSKAFMKMIMPSHAPRMKEYKEDGPIFAVHGVEAQLASMYEPEVRMPSGGSIVIQGTEALTSIDVNSGRSTTERNVEETAIKTNLEAAREVARQMRLRDVAGLVVIDFIDMYYGKNRRQLEKAMKDYLKNDRAKIQLGRISPFGLMEMSRQRLRPSIAESSTRLCGQCNGTGFVKSMETVSIQVIRLLEREAVSGDYDVLKIQTTADVAMHLLNDKRELIQEIEQQNEVQIQVHILPDLASGQFKLFKTNEDGKEQLHQEQDDDRGRKRKGRGRRGGRGRKRNGEEENGAVQVKDSDASSQDDDAEQKDVAEPSDSSDADGEPKPDRPARKRGGRRRSRSNAPKDASAQNAQAAPDKPEVAEAPAQAPTAEASETTDEKPKRPRRRRASTKRPKSADDAKEAEPAGDAEKTVAPVVAKITESVKQSEAEINEEQPKRKGWWNRVVQGEQSDA